MRRLFVVLVSTLACLMAQTDVRKPPSLRRGSEPPPPTAEERASAESIAMAARQRAFERIVQTYSEQMQKTLKIGPSDLIWNGSDSEKKRKFSSALVFEQMILTGEFGRPTESVSKLLNGVSRLAGIFLGGTPVWVRLALDHRREAAQAAEISSEARRFDENASRIATALVQEFAPADAKDFENATALDKAQLVVKVIGDIERSQDFPNAFSILVADQDPWIGEESIKQMLGPELKQKADGWHLMHVGQRTAIVRVAWADALKQCSQLLYGNSQRQLEQFVSRWELDRAFQPAIGRESIRRTVRGAAPLPPGADDALRIGLGNGLSGVDFAAMVKVTLSERDQRAYQTAPADERSSYHRAAAALVVAYRLAFLIAC